MPRPFLNKDINSPGNDWRDMEHCVQLQKSYGCEYSGLLSTPQLHKITKKFIKNVPYPSQEVMEERMAIDTYIKYQHDICKTIYENILNADEIKKCGEKLWKIGGYYTMNANFYAISNYSPFAEMNVTTGIARLYMEQGWDGVGDWRA